MTVRRPRYSKEEFARRGDEIYESQVHSQVEEGNYGKIVAGSFAVPKATTSKPKPLKLPTNRSQTIKKPCGFASNRAIEKDILTLLNKSKNLKSKVRDFERGYSHDDSRSYHCQIATIT